MSSESEINFFFHSNQNSRIKNGSCGLYSQTKLINFCMKSNWIDFDSIQKLQEKNSNKIRERVKNKFYCFFFRTNLINFDIYSKIGIFFVKNVALLILKLYFKYWNKNWLNFNYLPTQRMKEKLCNDDAMTFVFHSFFIWIWTVLFSAPLVYVCSFSIINVFSNLLPK